MEERESEEPQKEVSVSETLPRNDRFERNVKKILKEKQNGVKPFNSRLCLLLTLFLLLDKNSQTILCVSVFYMCV